MFVAYPLYNNSIDFDENLKDCVWRYQKSKENSLNYVKKYSKCQIQSSNNCSCPSRSSYLTKLSTLTPIFPLIGVH